MTNEIDVLTIGETMVMLVPPDQVPLAKTDSLTVHIGGAESNVATYLAALGFQTRWVSMLGDDPLGELVLRQVAQAGVDTSAVVQVPGGSTGLYFKDVQDNTTAVYYYRDRSAARGLSPSVLADPLLRSGRVLHLSGITAALSSTARDLVVAAVHDRANPDRLVSFDVNYRPKLWASAEAAPVLADLANASDVVFVGLDEAHSLWGCPTVKAVRETLPKPEILVVKDGPIGAYSFGPSGETFVSAPRVMIVEPVGAGDAFAAGYLAATLEDHHPEARLRLGHLVAAAALGVRSDHARLPDRAWLQAQLRISSQEWSQLDLSRSA